tara:strand:+ start:225 stop:425 length:201 start_codon:yes stop_codon:yes gene_type:complete
MNGYSTLFQVLEEVPQKEVNIGAGGRAQHQENALRRNLRQVPSEKLTLPSLPANSVGNIAQNAPNL